MHIWRIVRLGAAGMGDVVRRAAPRRSSARAPARRGEGAQKKTGATVPAFVRMTFCVDDGLGFVAGCEKEAGVVNAVVDMV